MTTPGWPVLKAVTRVNGETNAMEMLQQCTTSLGIECISRLIAASPRQSPPSCALLLQALLIAIDIMPLLMFQSLGMVLYGQTIETRLARSTARYIASAQIKQVS